MISIDPIDMFSEHIMTLAKQLDEHLDRMADVFQRNPNLVQLKQVMHTFIGLPCRQTKYVVKRRVQDLVDDLTMNEKDGDTLKLFVEHYLALFESYSPAQQEVLHARLATEVAKQIIARHQLKPKQ